MLTLKPIAAVKDAAELLARIPPELVALAAAPAPWTSYVAFAGDGVAVGVCTSKQAPDQHKDVEIAYLTFPECEGRGHGTGDGAVAL